jgi:hypothetical protein
MATLESAGYVYDPFTTTDVFGAPPQMFMERMKSFQRDSEPAIPQLAQKEMQLDMPQGSGPVKQQPDNSENHMLYLAVAAAVLGWAFFYK